MKNISEMFHIKTILVSGMVVHTFHPSTWKAETIISLSSRQDWSTISVPGQLGLLNEILFQTNKQTNKNKWINKQTNK